MNAGRLVTDPDVLAAISHDEAEWAPVGQAVAAVRARSEDEVRHVVRTCAQLGAPVVPRGAGTGLSGGANAIRGCVSGEHGIGLLKRDGMRRELDPGALAMQEAVCRALDPRGIFNPGKG
ncbi:MAG TPA: FAD-linked oxidase C-terminal domain-containing protein [Trebonia sp.]